jgi:hypothetical protein
MYALKKAIIKTTGQPVVITGSIKVNKKVVYRGYITENGNRTMVSLKASEFRRI